MSIEIAKKIKFLHSILYRFTKTVNNILQIYKNIPINNYINNGNTIKGDTMKIKKLTKITITILLFISIIIIHNVLISNKEIKDNQNQKQEILSHYSSNILAPKNTKLYIKENNNYIITGILTSSQILKLNSLQVTENTKYFPLETIEGYYINYKDAQKTDKELIEIEKRYKNYIPFNETIITKENATYYDNKTPLYKLKKSYKLKVLKKTENAYYTDFNNKLLKILKEDIQEIITENNQTIPTASKIRVIAFHSFYDENEISEKWCRNSICHNIKDFDQQIKYLKENNYFTLNTSELEQFIDGEINLPKNSVMITIDDGLMVDRAIKLLDKNKLNATIFLITSSYKPDNYTQSKYIEFHSHGHNLHTQNICPYGQGGAIKCKNKEYLLDDLKQSSTILGGSQIFCYPFYEYNNYSISVLKEAGYKMAFAGYIDDGYAKVGTDKYQIPRYTITSDITINKFAQIIKN